MNHGNSETRVGEQLEAACARFEKNWKVSPPGDIKNYLPDPGDAEYLEILDELIRLDIELRWSAGCPLEIEAYLEAYPEIRSNGHVLNDISFEDYRLRYRCTPTGESAGSWPLKKQYAERLGIDVESWPVWYDRQAAGPAHAGGLRFPEWSPEAAAAPRPGESCCGFDLVGLLGEGACGKVYLARQNDLANRLVALKVTTEISSESRHLARLQHGNIVPVFSVHETGGLTAICMPFVGVSTIKDLLAGVWDSRPGSPSDWQSQKAISTVQVQKIESVLQTISDAEDRLLFRQTVESREGRGGPPDRTWTVASVDIVTKIAGALTHAHERGIVHGDIKPGNILLTEDQEPLLLDFHLARNFQVADPLELVGGTLPYMAPEQFEGLISGVAKTDPRSDIYSLGVVLCEILGGELPFPPEGGDLRQRAGKILESRKRLPALASLGNSTDLASIVHRCLQYRVADRYQSSAELMTDLVAHQQNRPLVHAPNRSPRERLGKFLRRHPRLASGTTVGLAALLVVALLGVILVQRSARIAALDAASESRAFVEQMTEAQLPLSIDDFASAKSAYQSTATLLNTFSSPGPAAWRASDRYGKLSGSLRQSEQQVLATTWFWMAEAGWRAARIAETASESARYREEALKWNRYAGELAVSPSIGLELQRAKIAGDNENAGTFRGLLKRLENHQADSGLDLLVITQTLIHHPLSLDYADRLVESNGRHYAAWIVAGNANITHGRHERGAACYRMAASLAPAQVQAHWLSGLACLEVGDRPGALNAFRQVIELDPTHVSSIKNAGLIYLEMNQPELALPMFSRAIEQKTDDSRVWLLRSEAAAALGKSRLAEQDLATFTDMTPVDAVGYQARGELFVHSAPQRAIDDFEKALEIHPRSVVAVNNLAYVYSEVLDDLPKAIEQQDRLVELEPENARHWVTRGVLLARSGERQRAIDDGDKALELKPDADIYYRSAGIYALTPVGSPHYKADLQMAMQRVKHAAFRDPGMVLKYIETDPDIEPLQSLDEFRKLIENLGELTVHPPLRQPAGEGTASEEK